MQSYPNPRVLPFLDADSLCWQSGDRVFLDNRERVRSILCFRRSDGELLWETFVPGTAQPEVGWPKSSYASSTPTTDGRLVYAYFGNHGLLAVDFDQHQVQAYDPATGEPLWWCHGLTDEVIPSPVVGKGMVFASSGRQGPTLAIRPGGTGDVTDSHLEWQEMRGSPFVPSTLLYQGYLYTLNDMIRVLSCYDATTGELMYRVRLRGEVAGHGISSSPIGVDGKVFITTDDGQTLVIRAGPEYELLHVNQLK